MPFSLDEIENTLPSFLPEDDNGGDIVEHTVDVYSSLQTTVTALKRKQILSKLRAQFAK